MTRRKERELALCLIFNLGFHEDESAKELFDDYIEYYPEDDEKDLFEEVKKNKYISDTYFGVAENIDNIDTIIKENSSGWKFERISRVSVSVLRLAIFEVLYLPDIPYEVTANEAVELAKKYDHDGGYSFVNGVLATVIKSAKEADKAKEEAEEIDE